MPPESTAISLLPAREVCARVGVSRGHLYLLMKRATHPFPVPIHVGRAARWPSPATGSAGRESGMRRSSGWLHR